MLKCMMPLWELELLILENVCNIPPPFTTELSAQSAVFYFSTFQRVLGNIQFAQQCYWVVLVRHSLLQQWLSLGAQAISVRRSGWVGSWYGCLDRSVLFKWGSGWISYRYLVGTPWPTCNMPARCGWLSEVTIPWLSVAAKTYPD